MRHRSMRSQPRLRDAGLSLRVTCAASSRNASSRSCGASALAVTTNCVGTLTSSVTGGGGAQCLEIATYGGRQAVLVRHASVAHGAEEIAREGSGGREESWRHICEWHQSG